MLLFVSLRLLVESSTPIALQWGERAGELLRLVLLYVAACLKIALKTLSTSGGRPELRSIILLLLDNTNCFWEELRCEIFFFFLLGICLKQSFYSWDFLKVVIWYRCPALGGVKCW